MHLFVNNLTNIDFSYLDSNRGMLGETWLASISLEGTLDQQGMVCDFGVIKKTVRQWLDKVVDHCLLVAHDSPQLILEHEADQMQVSWQYSNRQLQCCSPAQAITLIEATEITPDTLSAWCVAQLRELLPETIDQITLRFTPEKIEHSYYHYSHGLKKHNGNCQRIAHGHRSTIEIVCDGERDHELEKAWCQRWQDIYIGTKEDLVESVDKSGAIYYHFAYHAPQGDFALTMPKDDCYLIETESTVELIAQHIAQTLKQENPNNSFVVKAYEGMGKGAIAYS